MFSNAAEEEQAKPKPLVWQFAALAQEQRFVIIAEHSLAAIITTKFWLATMSYASSAEASRELVT
jgi:hypothetical protein